MIAKTNAVVRAVEVFSPVSRIPPKEIQNLNLALQSCALEADQSMLKRHDRRTFALGYA